MNDDDLTASHWDDVLAPSQIGLGSRFDDVLNHDPWSDSPRPKAYGEPDLDEDDNEDNNDDDQSEHDQAQPPPPVAPQVLKPATALVSEAREHQHDLVSQLTAGVDDDDIITPQQHPRKVVLTLDPLFHDKGLPIQLNLPTPLDLGLPIKPVNFRALKPRKYLRKVIKELDSSVVGPLEAKSSPKKAQRSSLSTYDQLVLEVNSPLFDRENAAPVTNKMTQLNLTLDDDDTTQSHTQQQQQQQEEAGKPSTEQERKPSVNPFTVSVGDPMKVGELTKAHVVYNVKTKYKGNPPATYQVTRRYRDFRWLYNQLQTNHPGLIIPPPPLKQMFIGRFNEDFIEDRRLLLEKMLLKILDREVLRDDADVKAFLTQPDLEIKGEEADGEVDEAEAGALLFMGFFSLGAKVEETDPWFTKQRSYIDEVESNLKQFYRALELIGNQRYELVGLYDEIAASADELAQLEMSKATTEVLAAFSEVQTKLKQNLDRTTMQDQLTLGFTIDEYLRLVGLIKHVLDVRTKIATQLHTYLQDYEKKQLQLDKQKRRQAVLDLLQFEVNKLKEKADTYAKRFDDISATIKLEMERFDLERVDDFRNAVEIFIESSIESQKEAIEIYETFYERQGLGDAKTKAELKQEAKQRHASASEAEDSADANTSTNGTKAADDTN